MWTRRSCFSVSFAGVDEPERKRKIIGAAFIDVFEQEAEKVGGAEFLAQGTLYPTSSKACRRSAAPRSPSSRITMSVACPRACA